MSVPEIMTALAALVVMARATCLSSMYARANWRGHALRFIGMALGYSVLSGGAAATLLLPAWASPLLLGGLALVFMSDRRRVR